MTHIGSPSLEEGSSQGRDENDQEVYSHRRTHLLDLRFDTSDYSPFVDWLLWPQSPLDVSRVHTLHISYVHSSNTGMHLINRLLRDIGDSLKDFKFKLQRKLWCELPPEFIFGLRVM